MNNDDIVDQKYIIVLPIRQADQMFPIGCPSLLKGGHMVRNHQYGYPNLNLHFFAVENILKPNFFYETAWSRSSGQQRAGDSKGY